MKNFNLALALLLTLISGCSSKSNSTTSSTGFSPNLTGLPTVASSPAPTNYSQSSLFIPPSLNDTYYSSSGAWAGGQLDLWGFHALNAFSQFASLTLPSQEIVVAVIDTGVDYDAPDLAGKLWMNQGEYGGGKESNGLDDDGNGYVDDFLGWNWVNDNNNPVDDYGHGSHVAGTIAATGNNSEGIVGVAPWVRIMSLKVCNYQGSCASSDIRAAIQYAVDNGAKIINMSVGGIATQDDSDAFNTAITQATESGVLVVTAAGNSSVDTTTFTPSNAVHAMAISANANDGGACTTFSNFGFKIDVSAPGCGFNGTSEVAGILSVNSRKCGASGTASCGTKNLVGENYVLQKGTSMSSPHVAGLAAVALTASSTATPMMLRQAILHSATATSTFGANGRHRNHGAGRASATNISTEAADAPGVKITAPKFNESKSQYNISFTLESRAHALTYDLKYVSYAGNPTNLKINDGTSISTGNQATSSSEDYNVNWIPPANGNYNLILEVTSNGKTYRDLVQVKATL